LLLGVGKVALVHEGGGKFTARHGEAWVQGQGSLKGLACLIEGLLLDMGQADSLPGLGVLRCLVKLGLKFGSGLCRPSLGQFDLSHDQMDFRRERACVLQLAQLVFRLVRLANLQVGSGQFETGSRIVGITFQAGLVDDDGPFGVAFLEQFGAFGK